MMDENIILSFSLAYNKLLLDPNTTINLYDKLDGADDVAVLCNSNNVILIFRVSRSEQIEIFSPKWASKFKHISNLIEEYNNLAGNSTLFEKPEYVDSLKKQHSKIVNTIEEKYNKINRFLYGEPWVTSHHECNYYYIKFNQLYTEISHSLYNQLRNKTIEQDKNRTMVLLSQIIEKDEANSEEKFNSIQGKLFGCEFDSSNPHLGIDSILDKILKHGIDSLSEDEKNFIKRIGDSI